MSYQVLARKWRPQTFEDVVGQSSITQTLSNAIRLGRIGHAFIFSGSRGIGKTTTARILAKALNCEQGPTAEPCNVCRHCTEITSGIAMDVVEIDGASNRGIDEIRELRENVKYSPATTRFKVIIIDEVHMLTREAFNALLKTLEEPPEHAKFILATTEAHKVPVTILSRCQRYDFRRIDPATLAGFLREICDKESIKVQDATLEVLARMADGGVRDSLSLLDQVISFSGQEIDHEQTMALLGRIDPELLFDVFRSIAAGTGTQALIRFGEYIDSGGDEAVFNRELMEMTRDLMALKMEAPSHHNIPDDIPGLFSYDQLDRMFKVLLDQEQAFRYTEHPRLLMDVALVKMSRIRSLVPLEEILGRLQSGAAPAAGMTRPGAQGRPGQAHRQPQVNQPGPATAPPRPPAQQSRTVPRPPPKPQIDSRNEPRVNAPKPIPRPPQKTPAPEKKSTESPPVSKEEPTTRPERPLKKRPTQNQAAETLQSPPVKTPRKPIDEKPETDNEPLRKLISGLGETHAPLKGMLSYAAVKEFDGKRLVVAFHPDYRIHLDLMQKYEGLEEVVAGAATEVFGSRLHISYVMGDSETPQSVVDQELVRKKRAQEAEMEMARSHPAVSKVLTMFRGKITKIQPRIDNGEPDGVGKSGEFEQMESQEELDDDE